MADLAQWVRLLWSREDNADVLRQSVRDRFGVRHAFLTSTGRAGLTVLLRAMRRLGSDRTEVIVPSYTCFSVAASVVKAGLRPRIVDIAPDTLDYSLEQLESTDFSQVLAIVATSLYGLPSNLPVIGELAARRGVFLIDDAAQAMGASVGGRPCGTWGHAGLFSLDKGKNVSAIDGGIVVTNSDELAVAFEREADSLGAPTAAETSVSAMKVLAYATLLRPWLYWMPNGVPQLGLGRTTFSTDFPLDRPSRLLTALGVTMLPHLDDFTRARVEHAAVLLESLRSLPGVRTIAPQAGATPVYLRLPVLLPDTRTRDLAIQRLTDAGIGASGSYPSSLADIAMLRDVLAEGSPRAEGGRYVAGRILTLPTHPFVTRADMGAIVRALEPFAFPAAPQWSRSVS